MKIIKKYKLKRKIKKLEKELFSKIFNELYNPYIDMDLEIDYRGTREVIEFNSKKIITKEWSFGHILGDIKPFKKNYIPKEKLKLDTYNELKKLDRLRKHLNFI